MKMQATIEVKFEAAPGQPGIAYLVPLCSVTVCQRRDAGLQGRLLITIAPGR